MAVYDDILEKLEQLEDIKGDIKEAILNKGVDVGNDMHAYPDAIREIGDRYLCFENVGESVVNVYLDDPDGGSSTLILENNRPNCEYTKDLIEWTELPVSGGVGIPALNSGEKMYLKGVNPAGWGVRKIAGVTRAQTFVLKPVGSNVASIEASGNIMSLIDGVGETTVIPNNYCFHRLFVDCTVLTTPPKLPATTLTTGCYNLMFNDCTSLTTAPELPATTLADNCYETMFSGCIGLESAPVLPAATLTQYCYAGMFSGCIGLESAPVLPAATLTQYCYYNMFNHCSNLSYVKCLATNTSATDCTSYWLRDAGTSVVGDKVFIKYGNKIWESGTSGIPDGWIVKKHASVKEDKSVVVSSDSSVTITPSPRGYTDLFLGAIGLDEVTVEFEELNPTPSPNYLKFTLNSFSATVHLQNNGPNNPNCEYSDDGGVTWHTMPTTSNTALELNSSDGILIRGTNPSGFSTSYSDFSTFVVSGSIAASGSVMSLIDGVGESVVIPSDYCFSKLFFGCSSLTTPPELPATTLTEGCYSFMFSGCTSLTAAPELPATTLVSDCYVHMFDGCTSLNFERVFFREWDPVFATTSWNYGVSNTGTFCCAHGLPIVIGDSNIPTGWKVLYNEFKKVELTQEEYDDLEESGQLDPDTKYVIVS